MFYPLKFKPVYKSYLWGGRSMEEKLNRIIPDGRVAESWELCCRDDGMSTISNGIFKDRLLSDIIAEYKESILGAKIYDGDYKMFPLFVKLIDANDKLSVQVHPDDDFAKKNGDYFGKTEMWYIIDAKPGARLVYGLKDGTSRSDFEKAINDGRIKDLLNEVPVSPGDVFYIPAGTVHALLDGLLVAEVQQNSNTTYRLYDWDRLDSNGKPRELHIEKALEVIDFDTKLPTAGPNAVQICTGYTIRHLISGRYFTIQEISVNKEYNDCTEGSNFIVYMSLDGEGSVDYPHGTEPISTGETVFIPATLGNYTIKGNLKLLKIFIEGH